MSKLTINIASVKVMRSHDYCHFEVNLAASVDARLIPRNASGVGRPAKERSPARR